MANHVSDGNLALAKIISDAEAAAYRRGVEDAARVAEARSDSHGASILRWEGIEIASILRQRAEHKESGR